MPDDFITDELRTALVHAEATLRRSGCTCDVRIEVMPDGAFGRVLHDSWCPLVGQFRGRWN